MSRTKTFPGRSSTDCGPKATDIAAIAEISPRAVDERVLEQADKADAILLTNDKDFGELIFRLGRGSSGVVLLRLEGVSTESKVESVAIAVAELGDRLHGTFTVIAPGRVRIRRASL